MFNSYNLLSIFYDKIYSKKPYKQELLYIKKILKKNNYKNILELGCGTGNYTHWIKKLFEPSKFHAVDINNKMLKIAKTKNIGVKFTKGEITSFKSKHKFDIIFCLFHVVNYLESEEKLNKFLNNSFKLLNDGGYLVFDFLDSSSISLSQPKIKKINFNYKKKSITRITQSKIDKSRKNLYIYHEYKFILKKKTNSKKENYKLRLFNTNEIKKIIMKNFKIYCYYEWMKLKKPTKNNWSSLLVLKKIENEL